MAKRAQPPRAKRPLTQALILMALRSYKKKRLAELRRTG